MPILRQGFYTNCKKHHPLGLEHKFFSSMEQHMEHLEEASSAESQAFSSTFENANYNRQERKKGIPWTEEEHRLFLMGLQKYGKGDWRNISRNYVITRTPTQVASHAHKYYIRQLSKGKDKIKPRTVNHTPSNNCNFHHIRSLLWLQRYRVRSSSTFMAYIFTWGWSCSILYGIMYWIQPFRDISSSWIRQDSLYLLSGQWSCICTNVMWLSARLWHGLVIVIKSCIKY